MAVGAVDAGSAPGFFQRWQSVIVAVIGVVGSIAAAYITADSQAAKTAQTTATKVTAAEIFKEQQRTSGGTIDSNGKILNQIGRTYTVGRQGPGDYKIQFDEQFDRDPVALVTVHSGTVPTVGRVEFADRRSIEVTTKRLDNNVPENSVFSFMVLEATKQNP
jgi:hypothetical protein